MRRLTPFEHELRELHGPDVFERRQAGGALARAPKPMFEKMPPDGRIGAVGPFLVLLMALLGLLVLGSGLVWLIFAVSFSKPVGMIAAGVFAVGSVVLAVSRRPHRS